MKVGRPLDARLIAIVRIPEHPLPNQRGIAIERPRKGQSRDIPGRHVATFRSWDQLHLAGIPSRIVEVLWWKRDGYGWAGFDLESGRHMPEVASLE